MQKKKYRVWLVHPEISRTKYNFVGVIENECLELEYLAAVLKQEGHEVFLYDGQVEERTFAQRLREYEPDVVYVCGRTRQENFMLEYCREAKLFNENIITILGGLHAQLCYERLYREEVDYILTTFDVFVVNQILETQAEAGTQKEELPQKIQGICYRGVQGWKKTDAQPFDIKRLPWPDRSYFNAHPGNYRYLELEHAAWVRTAYCCPYRCQFCHRNRMNKGKYVCRDIEDVVEEIAQIQAENIYIADDDFLYDEERLSRFVELVKKKGIQKRYICYGRTDFIAEHETLMRQLQEIGLYYVLSGLEAIEDTRLQQYRKASDVEKNIKSIEICNRLGLHMMGMFIVDLDYCVADFRKLYRFIQEKNLRHVAISIYTPELCTENYEQYRERILTNNPSHWDYLHLVAQPTYMSVKAYYLQYYLLLIKLFVKAWREGVYDFLDYKGYVLSFIGNVFRGKRRNDDA